MNLCLTGVRPFSWKESKLNNSLKTKVMKSVSPYTTTVSALHISDMLAFTQLTAYHLKCHSISIRHTRRLLILKSNIISVKKAKQYSGEKALYVTGTSVFEQGKR